MGAEIPPKALARLQGSSRFFHRGCAAPLEMPELSFIKNELIAEQIIFCHCGSDENEVGEALRVARVRNSGH